MVARLRRRGLAALAAGTLSLAPATGCMAEGAPASPADPAERWRERHWRVPSPRAKVEMHVTVRVPRGRGPFPLAVVNHGSTESAFLREEYPRPTFDVLSSWLVERGYAVALPQRPGHGETAGPYLETAGGCHNADYARAGYAAAESIAAAADHLLRQPFVRPGPVLLVGHSAGAWGALALASISPRLVGGVVNFSGGRGGRAYGLANRNCAPDRLVATAALFGRTVKAPTLWIYAENDSFFGPGLSGRMAEAFRAAGAPADYRLLPPVEEDGHGLVFAPDAVRHWGPIVAAFLTRLR